MLAGLVVLVCGGLLFFAAHWEEKISVGGNLSATEVAEIKSAVRAEMRRRIFPRFSWWNIKHLPAATVKELRYKILSIDCYQTNIVRVQTGLPRPEPGDPQFVWELGWEWYDVEKGTNGWRLRPSVTYLDFDVLLPEKF
jgi:hypothetical protein